MRLFWIVTAFLTLFTPSSALFATLIRVSPTLAKMVMFGLGTMGPTFFTTSVVYFLGRHFGFREIRPKFRKPVKPGDNRVDFAGQFEAQDGPGYAYYDPQESQYAKYGEQGGQFEYVEGRSVEQEPQEGPEELGEETPGLPVAAPEQFTHPRGRKIVSRA